MLFPGLFFFSFFFLSLSFFRSLFPFLYLSLHSFSPRSTGFKSIQALELDQLLDDDNFELVSKIARELAQDERAVEDEDGGGRGNLKTSSRDMAEIVARVTELVTKVAPNEIEAVDIMLQEFAGREQELIDQLTNIYERSIAAQTRLLSQAHAKKSAKKASRASQKQPRGALPARSTALTSLDVGELRPATLTSLDVDELISRSDYAAIAALASAPRTFRELKRGAGSALGEVKAQQSDLICSLFAENDSAGIIAACVAFGETQQEDEHYASDDEHYASFSNGGSN